MYSAHTFRARFALACVMLAVGVSTTVHAQDPIARGTAPPPSASPLPSGSAGPPLPAPGQRRGVDRAAVRFIAPEIGGPSRPRFLTEHEVACLARLESLSEEGEAKGDFADRYARVVVNRAVAEEMLEGLQVKRGVEPKNLLELAHSLRADLAVRVGGPAVLAAALKEDEIEPAELDVWLRRRVRAATYLNEAVTPIFSPTEDDLFQAFRLSNHPYKELRFDDVRKDFSRYLAFDRFRSLALEYLQSARSRVTISFL